MQEAWLRQYIDLDWSLRRYILWDGVFDELWSFLRGTQIVQGLGGYCP